MPEFTLDEVQKAMLGHAEILGKHREFSNVAIDSREIKGGELFFALKGPNFDGHDFVHEAAGKGVRGVVVSDPIQPGDLPHQISVITVDDTSRALQRLARHNRQRLGTFVIAVTGSTGKTSTKDMIHSILSRKMETIGTYRNFNNEIGVALTLLRLEKHHEACVVELAMRAPGEIRELSQIVLPDIGVITNVGESHIELLGSVENIASAKAELIEVLGHKGVIVLNGDCPYTAGMKEMAEGRVVLFGLEDINEVRGKDIISLGKDGTRFVIEYGQRCLNACVNVPGVHNVYNGLAAAAVALVSGLDAESVVEGLANLSLTSQRMDIIETASGLTLIDDSYNASPSSMEAALDVLKDIGGGRRRTIAVLGNMLELGPVASRAHTDLGKVVIDCGVDILMTVGDLAGLAGQEAVRLGKDEGEVFTFCHKRQAIDVLISLIRPDDVVLVKGSRTMEMEEVSKALLGNTGGGSHV